MHIEDKIAELQKSYAQWEKENAAKFSRERKREFVSEEGHLIKRVYTPLDLAEKGFDYQVDLGLPGSYPYTRGNEPTGYRTNIWGIGKYAGRATPEESNKLWKSILAAAAGAGTISVAQDLPTQLGYDPGHPMSKGEVGRTGASLSSLKDWEIAFDGIDLGKAYVSVASNALGPVSIASHICTAENQGVELKSIQGHCQNDPLRQYVARGNYIYPPEPSVRLVADSMVYCAQYIPNYKPICLLSPSYSEAGANGLHESAINLAMLCAYLDGAVNRGVNIDTIAPNLRLHMSGDHSCFFEEIAKIRATRKLYARLLKERYGARKPESLKGSWGCAQGGIYLYRQQYMNNIVRTAIAILVGAFTGCSYIDVRPYDEQHGMVSDEAIDMVIRSQQIVANETGIPDTIDPLGGSYYVETLTKEFEEKLWAELEAVDRRGGAIRCIEDGYFRCLIAEDAYDWQRRFESGEIRRVGVNWLQAEEEAKPIRVYRTDSGVEQKRIVAVQKLKANRDNGRVNKTLKEIKQAASSKNPRDNTMYPILEAVRAYATIGEIGDVLREVWGEYIEPSVF